MNRIDLVDCKAIVTGGSGGLGQAIMARLRRSGAAVANFDRREGGALAEAELFCACDVTDAAAVDAAVGRTVDAFGRIDILVNNAGIAAEAKPVADASVEAWRRVLDVNLTGAFLACREAGRLMLAQGRGSIINLASTGGLMSFLPEVGATISYTTSKGALISLTRDLAAQWAERGVRVNAIAPGSMAAGMTHTIPDTQQKLMIERIPMRRHGRPDELRGAVAYLASDASSYTTGAVLVVDGGQTIV